MIDPTWTLSNFPVSIAVTRFADGRILYTNSRFQTIFRGSKSDFLNRFAGDLVAPSEIHKFREVWQNGGSRPEGVPNDVFRLFRRIDGEEFIGWTRNIRHVHPDHGVLIISALFEYYDETSDALNFSNFITFRNDVIRGKVSAYFAHELNTRLAKLTAIVDGTSSDREKISEVRDELSELRKFGEKLFRIGLQSTDAAELLERYDAIPVGRPNSLTDLSILVVDDEPNFASLLASLVRTKVKAVDIAHSGDETAALLADNTYDAALVDLNLGVEDGRVIADLIEDLSPTTKIVFMTGFAHAASILEAMSSSVVLRKPFSLAEVETALAREFSR
jgi:CheY-like chemotaxis protein